MKYLILLAPFFLGGCLSEEVRTVEYFKQNNVERAEKIAWCKDSADRRKSTNCVNAFSAQAEINISLSLRKGLIFKK